jgi:hypothetical protein
MAEFCCYIQPFYKGKASEWVAWGTFAKVAKTRARRVTRTIERLLAGRKRPAD